jgi:hypothetical protein
MEIPLALDHSNGMEIPLALDHYGHISPKSPAA